MEAKLKSFIIICPITSEDVEIVPVPTSPIEYDESCQEYVFQFDCHHCGQVHTVTLLDYF